MAFHRINIRKDLELPTFVDIVFLLLIFFLLTYSPVLPKSGESSLELNLPMAEGASKVNQNERLENLMIEIVPVNMEKPELGFQVSVLLPFEEYGIREDMPLTYRRAKAFAEFYQRQSVLLPDNFTIKQSEFLKLPAIQLISSQLDRYVERKFPVPKITNRVEIRADKNVAFRVINFIIEKCSSYGDLVPSLVFRTMYQTEK